MTTLVEFYGILVSMRGIYLGLGSNLGDRLGNLTRAVEALPPRINLVSASPIYETDPWGYLEQPKFLNQVVEVETSMKPHHLLAYLKQIERKMGRGISFRNGPRLIDIDILLYGDLILDEEGLVIPHPRMHERAFVLKPLSDLRPDLSHPVIGKSIRSILQDVDQSGVALFK